jgi:hypothetical protein
MPMHCVAAANIFQASATPLSVVNVVRRLYDAGCPIYYEVFVCDFAARDLPSFGAELETYVRSC